VGALVGGDEGVRDGRRVGSTLGACIGGRVLGAWLGHIVGLKVVDLADGTAVTVFIVVTGQV
jgi:hypothetical protein